MWIYFGFRSTLGLFWTPKTKCMMVTWHMLHGFEKYIKNKSRHSMIYLHTWQVYRIAHRDKDKWRLQHRQDHELVIIFPLMNNIYDKFISKYDISLVVPHSYNHEVLCKAIINYPRNTLSQIKGGTRNQMSYRIGCPYMTKLGFDSEFLRDVI